VSRCIPLQIQKRSNSKPGGPRASYSTLI